MIPVVQDPIGNVLPNSHTEPLSCLFPLTSTLGYKIAPTLDHLIGVSPVLDAQVTCLTLTDSTSNSRLFHQHEAVEHIDTAADALCIAAEADPSGGGGVCQNILAAIDDIVQAKGGPVSIVSFCPDIPL